MNFHNLYSAMGPGLLGPQVSNISYASSSVLPLSFPTLSPAMFPLLSTETSMLQHFNVHQIQQLKPVHHGKQTAAFNNRQITKSQCQPEHNTETSRKSNDFNVNQVTKSQLMKLREKYAAYQSQLTRSLTCTYAFDPKVNSLLKSTRETLEPLIAALSKATQILETTLQLLEQVSADDFTTEQFDFVCLEKQLGVQIVTLENLKKTCGSVDVKLKCLDQLKEFCNTL